MVTLIVHSVIGMKIQSCVNSGGAEGGSGNVNRKENVYLGHSDAMAQQTVRMERTKVIVGTGNVPISQIEPSIVYFVMNE